MGMPIRPAAPNKTAVTSRINPSVWATIGRDGFVTLAATGAAPVGLGWTGDPAFNVPASLLGTPAVSLPLLSEADMPLGLQLIGRADEDAHLMAVAEWVWQNYGAT